MSTLFSLMILLNRDTEAYVLAIFICEYAVCGKVCKNKTKNQTYLLEKKTKLSIESNENF